MKQVLLTALLGAAAFGATPALAQSEAYRALGTEPFWSLRIEGNRLIYEDGGSGQHVTDRVRRVRNVGERRVHEGRRIQVTRWRTGECSDGMSDFTYADEVRVRVNGRTVRGCGGGIMPPETLAGTSWRLLSINGEDVSREENYEIAFEANRLSGRAGCNRFTGPYRIGRDGLQAGPLAMTRMACPGPRMRHEQAVGRILGERVRVTYPNGEMVITGPSGTIRARRAM